MNNSVCLNEKHEYFPKTPRQNRSILLKDTFSGSKQPKLNEIAGVAVLHIKKMFIGEKM